MEIRLEELSLNAWPSHQTTVTGGWLLRFADGYTRRANSILPLYNTETAEYEKKVVLCESEYTRRGLPVVFKMNSHPSLSSLDAYLSELGYKKEVLTSVQTVELSNLTLNNPPSVQLTVEPSTAWLAAVSMNAKLAPNQIDALKKILGNIIPKHIFASINDGERTIACGLGVVEQNYIGLFDILTDEAFRKRGLATDIIHKILTWGMQNGANNSYLQVIKTNTPAIALYNKLCFAESYQYWYRVKP